MKEDKHTQHLAHSNVSISSPGVRPDVSYVGRPTSKEIHDSFREFETRRNLYEVVIELEKKYPNDGEFGKALREEVRRIVSK